MNNQIKKYLFGIVSLIFVAIVIVVMWLMPASEHSHSTHDHQNGMASSAPVDEAKTIYTCPMHPQYTSPSPGTCPICGMTLVPMTDSKRGESGGDSGAEANEPPKRAPIYLDEGQRQTIGLKTAKVEIRSVNREIRIPGTVAFDPALAVAQSEFIEAKRSGDGSLLRAASERLKLMGMSADEIASLGKSMKVDKDLYAPIPGGKAWVYGIVYENDIPYIKIGQSVMVMVPNVPESHITGKISSISPVIDAKSRTQTIRTEVDNSAGLLRPNLYVDITVNIPLPQSVVVPLDAVMWNRNISYVFVDKGDGWIVPREVAVLPANAEFMTVREGLVEGDVVIRSANFLIDAESQMKNLLKGHKH